jgi:alkylation response protein AidB-like acyl-CoA dehydrogenase
VATFGFSESQTIAQGLSEQVFAGAGTMFRLAEVEAWDVPVDRTLWRQCADAGLLGLCLPADLGGDGLGFSELVIILEQQGRYVVPIPLAPTIVSALAVDAFGSAELRREVLPLVLDGSALLASALSSVTSEPNIRATVRGGAVRLDGHELSVPAAPVARWLLVSAVDKDGTTGLYLVDAGAEGVGIQSAKTTNRQSYGHVTLDGSPARRLGDTDAVEWLRQRMTVAACAIQSGVARAAVDLTARYVSERQQFGKPLSYFQAVLMRIADAQIATQMIQVTCYAAADLLVEGGAFAHVGIAKWWASVAGTSAVEAALHLHGGAGNVLDYPLARYYLWAKQIDVELGSAPYHLQALGDWLAQSDLPDEVVGL